MVRDPAEGLGEVKIDTVTRAALFKVFCDIIKEWQEIGSARAPLQGTMLGRAEEACLSEVIKSCSLDKLLQQLADYTGEGDWTEVVGRLSVTRLVDRADDG